MRWSLLSLLAATTIVCADEPAEALLERGRASEALPLFERALAATPGDARLLCGCALALADLGRIEDAWDRYDEAARRPGSAFYRAKFLKSQGRFESAIPLYEEVVATEGNAPRKAESLVALGYCMDGLGRPKEGLERAVEGLSMSRGPAARARALNVIGICFSSLGKEEEAATRYRSALDLLQRLHKGDHPDIAMVRHNLAVSLVHQKEPIAASRLLELALAMDKRIFGDAHIRVALDHNSHGILVARSLRYARLTPLLFSVKGAPRKAEHSFLRALEIARRLRHPYVHAFATNLGICLERADRCEDALPLFEEAAAEIETLHWRARGLAQGERQVYFAYLRQGEPYRRLAALHVRSKRPAEAVRWLEVGRARGVLDLLARSRFDALAEAERRARERKDTQLIQRIERVRRNPAARRERAQLVRELVPLGRPVDPRALQRLLGRKELLLMYSLASDPFLDTPWIERTPGAEAPGGTDVAPPPTPVTPEERNARDTTPVSQVLLVPPTGGKIRPYRVSWSAERIARAVDSLVASAARRGGFNRGMGRAPTGVGSVDSAGLYRALVPSALERELRRAERVYIVLHGALHRLPFEMLMATSTNRGIEQSEYWIERGPPIAYVPSGSVLQWCRQRRDEQRTTDHRFEIVALGDCRFGDSLPPLPGTRREVESIAGVLKPAMQLLGEKATAAALFDFAPQARILHIATHQLIEETEAGIVSRLALTDGDLKLEEMLNGWRDRLSACELVVLSACETLKGRMQTDEAPHAMPLGFLYAGCPSVIGSLWRVDDESTADLFIDFYKRLEASGGRDKLKAFTEARQALRKKYPDPFHWAAFVYIGDPR